MIVSITFRVEESLCKLIDELADEQRRSRANFVEQFLRVSLMGDLDRDALIEKMNPATAPMLSAIRKERDRLAGLSQRT